MPENFLHTPSSIPFPDRRKTSRADLRSVVYVQLEPGNGGLVLNLSEDGIAVQAAEPITSADFPKLRFCFPNSTKWIEVEGKLVWEDASRKKAGIQFIRLATDARAQIRNYLNGARAPLEVTGDAGSPAVAEPEPRSPELAQGEVGLSAEFDSMFPSEKEAAPGRGSVVRRGADFFPSEASADVPLNGNRAPWEPAVGTLESDIPAEAQVRPDMSNSHRYRAPARPRSVVGVDQALAEGSKTQLNPESPSNEHDFAMPVPNFRHPPPNPSPNVSPSSPLSPSIDPKIDSEADRATHERLVAAFAAAVKSPAAPPNKTPLPDLSNESHLRSSDHPPIPFSGFGYQPSEFEEPFGKKWIGVAAVLIAIFGIGVVLAVGPANVKDLIFRRHAIFESLAGPPPPALPEKQAGKPGEDANANANETPAQPATSPAALPSDTLDVRGSQSSPPGTVDPAPPVDSPASPSAKNSDGQYGEPDTSDPEAEVLQFQREHSGVNSTSAKSYAPTDASVAYPKPSSPSPAPPAASIANSEANRAPSEPQRSVAQTQQPGDGVVAIRSSFNAVRGSVAAPSEPSETSAASNSLVPGPLKTMRQPNYPAEALRAHVEGTVTLRATVDRTGAVQAVKLMGGPPILAPAAIESVRQWQYAPTTLNGQAVESTEDISVIFRMANSVAAPH